jgi:hypothetical protein
MDPTPAQIASLVTEDFKVDPRIVARLLQIVDRTPPGGIIGWSSDLKSIQTPDVLRRLDLRNAQAASFVLGYHLAIQAMVSEDPHRKQLPYSSSFLGLCDRTMRDPLALADMIFNGHYGKKFLVMGSPKHQKNQAIALLPVRCPSEARFVVAAVVEVAPLFVTCCDVRAAQFVQLVDELSRDHDPLCMHHVMPNLA